VDFNSLNEKFMTARTGELTEEVQGLDLKKVREALTSKGATVKKINMGWELGGIGGKRVMDITIGLGGNEPKDLGRAVESVASGFEFHKWRQTGQDMGYIQWLSKTEYPEDQLRSLEK
jgi:hypothetical protein